MSADTRVMPLVLGVLVIVLAALVLALRATALVTAGGRERPVDWLSRAVDDDRDRGLALTRVSTQYR